MINLFTIISTLSFAAVYFIIAVLIIRLFIRKAPKIYSYALWGIVLFRLLCPLTLESTYNFLPVNENSNIQQKISNNITSINNDPSYTVVDLPIINTVQNKPDMNLNRGINKTHLLSVIWIAGTLTIFLYNIYSYIKLKRKLHIATLISDNIYETDMIQTPFVMGIINPQIYLPTNIHESERDYIIKHEQFHIKRKDYLVKLLWMITVSLHWFNPLVWLSYMLMSNDMEMSCDEAVLKNSETDIRHSYSTSLVNLATEKTDTVNVLYFGEGNMKERIKNIMNYKKPKLAVSVILIIIVGLVIYFMITSPVGEVNIPDDDNIVSENTNDNEENDVQNISDNIKAEVDKNLEIIVSSPDASSNPYDYIREHEQEYQNILKLGDDALNYMLVEFEQGNAEGLRAYIMMVLCKELLGAKADDSETDPQKWFDNLNIRTEVKLPDFKYDGDDEVMKLVYETEISINHKDDSFTIVAPHILDTCKEDDYLKVFVVTFAQSYKLYDDVLTECGGSVIPSAYTYKKNNGVYELVKEEHAKDGSYFAPSIEEYSTKPVSGRKIIGLKTKTLIYYSDYDDIIKIERENLIKHLNDNNLHNIKFQNYSGEQIKLN